MAAKKSAAPVAAPIDVFIQSLGKQGLEVQSARDALAVRQWLDTGNYALNWAISGRFLRGYPLGHSVEIFGDPGTGKSFLVARAIAMAQSKQGVALLDDTEGAYNPDWAETVGVDMERLAYRRSGTVKEHLSTAQAFLSAYEQLKLKSPGVLACDSLALLSTEHELEVGLDKRDMTKAAEIKAFFRIIGRRLSNLPVVYIAANHLIATIGGYGYERATPGGSGLKFQATLRLDMRTVSKIKRGDEIDGVLCRAVVDKNRIVAPWKEVRFTIPFNRPISPASGLIPLLLKLKLIEEDGTTLVVRGEKTKIKTNKSKDNFIRQDESGEELLETYPDLLAEADELLAQRKGGVLEIPEDTEVVAE